jgi:hypothetical protein
MKRNEVIRALIQIEKDNLWTLDDEVKDVLFRRLKNFFELLQEQADGLQKEADINFEQWHIFANDCSSAYKRNFKLKTANRILKKSLVKAIKGRE